MFCSYMDRDVLSFLRDLRRHFNEDITLGFSIEQRERRAWTLMAQELWPLFGHGITTLIDMKRVDFVQLRKYISPSVLLDCANLRKIFTHTYPRRPARAMTATDATTGRHFDVEEDLFNWLHTPRNNDDLPKVLRFVKWRVRFFQRFVDDLKLVNFLKTMFFR